MSLAEFVEATATRYGIPGVTVGVWANGKEVYVSHGVTSVDNPLPVDEDTLYQLASVTKTFTATALMRLVEQGRVELDAPVRRYVPELELSDETAAARITVLNLLNHTAGLDWGVIVDTGDGDDALAGYVAKMAELAVIAEPGARASYSQAGFNLVGRIIEKVTGKSYEQAVAELVLAPAGLSNTFFAPKDVMTRRFAVGHNADEDGTLSISRPWTVTTRGNRPGGGIVSSVSDQLKWARVHLGDDEVLRRMQEPTVTLRASTLGDALGIAWFVRDIDDVRTIGHGGSASGQFAELLIVPERNLAVTVMANAGPNGIPFNQEIVRWVLEHYLGVIDRDPEPLPYDEKKANEVVGNYEIDAMTFDITTDGTTLKLDVRIKPEIRESSDTEMPPDHEPFPFGLLQDDEYIVTAGAFTGQRGFFSRDDSGAIVGVDLAGRLFTRVRA
jgi:CubicO group peptidase (beta-lactamase class C family)